MIIIKIFIPLLFIVLNSCKGAEVGRFYAFNHPPFDDNDNIPVTVEHNQEVRKSKSITFSDNPTTFHPRFKTLGDESNTAEITTVKSEFYEDAPTSFRVISGGYSGGKIPVNVVYDKPEAVISNERRWLVQQRRKPIDDKELRTAGERKLVYQTIRRNKFYDEGLKRAVQENISLSENFKTKTVIEHHDQNQGIIYPDVSTIKPKNMVTIDSLSTHDGKKKTVVSTSPRRTIGHRNIDKEIKLDSWSNQEGVMKTGQESIPIIPAIRITKENLKTKTVLPDDEFYTGRGSIKTNNQSQGIIKSSVVSISGQTMKPKSTSKEVNLSSHGSIKSDTDGRYNIRNYNEGVKKSAQAISGNTKTFIDNATEFHPSSQTSSGYGLNQMVKRGTEIKDENETKASNRDAVEKQRWYARTHSRGKQPVVPILESESYVYAHNGDFHYSYEGADGTKAFESGELKYSSHQNSDEKDMLKGEAVSGGFSYTDADGKDYSLTYTADENGYRPMGTHLPTPPPIPPAIARALKYLATKPTPTDEEATKSWW